MTGIAPAVVDLSGGNLVLVIVVALIALGALAMAAMFRQEVLAAGEGTDNMKNIAQAVQEGANAYLQRQFRTLAIFAAVAFFLLLALPADDATVRIFRSVFFLVGAGFSATVGYLGMSLAVRANLRVAAAAQTEGRDPATLRCSAALVLCCGRDEAEIARRAAAIGREVGELRQNGAAGTPDEVAAKIRAYRDAGAERMYLQVLDLDDLEHIELIADAVMGQLQG